MNLNIEIPQKNQFWQSNQGSVFPLKIFPILFAIKLSRKKAEYESTRVFPRNWDGETFIFFCLTSITGRTKKKWFGKIWCCISKKYRRKKVIPCSYPSHSVLNSSEALRDIYKKYILWNKFFMMYGYLFTNFFWSFYLSQFLKNRWCDKRLVEFLDSLEKYVAIVEENSISRCSSIYNRIEFKTLNW